MSKYACNGSKKQKKVLLDWQSAWRLEGLQCLLQVEKSLLLIKNVCQWVVSSQELKLLLHCLLDWGNFLNEGTHRAGALGMPSASICTLLLQHTTASHQALKQLLLKGK